MLCETNTIVDSEWYEMTHGVATAYYPFNGQPIAMKHSSTLNYLLHDRLGSLIAAGTASGGEVASARYWPFGGLRTSTGTLPTDRLFTGQIRDLGDNRLNRFSFFKARYYNATMGKFVQPDSIVPTAKNPQALNRYAFALNNPLRLVDPSGHDPRDWFNQQWLDEFRAAHQGQNPTVADYAYRLASMMEATGGERAGTVLQDLRKTDWTRVVENSANLGLAWGSGELSEQFRWTGPFLRGGYRIPEYLEYVKAPTGLAKAARIGGAITGVALVAIDEYQEARRWQMGQVPGQVALEEAAVIAVGAAVAIGAGLTAPVWLAVGVGILSIAAVGAVNHAIETNDFSGPSLLQGAEGTFWPLQP